MTTPDGAHLAFPFRIGANGRTCSPSTVEEHVHDELLQLILTNLGEREYLPEFGGDVRRLVFENIDDALRGMSKARITRALNQWLGHRVTLENVDIKFENATFEVSITYHVAGTEDSRVMRFQRTNV